MVYNFNEILNGFCENRKIKSIPLYLFNDIKSLNSSKLISEKQKKFLMGPYPLSCPFHYHVGPSQVIEIKSDNPVDFSFDPITIKGKLEVKYNEETGSFFYLETINS